MAEAASLTLAVAGTIGVATSLLQAAEFFRQWGESQHDFKHIVRQLSYNGDKLSQLLLKIEAITLADQRKKAEDILKYMLELYNRANELMANYSRDSNPQPSDNSSSSDRFRLARKVKDMSKVHWNRFTWTTFHGKNLEGIIKKLSESFQQAEALTLPFSQLVPRHEPITTEAMPSNMATPGPPGPSSPAPLLNSIQTSNFDTDTNGQIDMQNQVSDLVARSNPAMLAPVIGISDMKSRGGGKITIKNTIGSA